MSMSNIAHISLASLNCRGLKKILTQLGRSFSRILRSLPYDILALQETHASTEQLQIRFNLSLQVSSSNWTPHCGLVTFNSSLTLIPLWSSTDGRIMATKVTHTSSLFEPITIYVMYAPATNTARFNFLHNSDHIFQYNRSPADRCILMGDFNHNLHRPTRSNRALSWTVGYNNIGMTPYMLIRITGIYLPFVTSPQLIFCLLLMISHIVYHNPKYNMSQIVNILQFR